MYVAVIVLFMLVLPLASIATELYALNSAAPVMALVGKWFTFWGMGARLGIAGVRQAFNPAFTARDVFGIEDEAVHPIVRELGFANLALALLGLLAIVPVWTAPAAVAGVVFFTLAGWKHFTAGERNSTRTVAMVSDLFIALVLAAYLISAAFAAPS